MMTAFRLLPVLLILFVASCEQPREAQVDPVAIEGGANPKLVAHTGEFERKVYTVTDGAYQAVGVHEVSNRIRDRLSSGACNVDTIAALMALSSRTLQRRLSEEGERQQYTPQRQAFGR